MARGPTWTVLIACFLASGAGYAPALLRVTPGTSQPSGCLRGGSDLDLFDLVRPRGGSSAASALCLRGGGGDETLVLASAEAAGLPPETKTWEVDHVLLFLEGLRPKFKDRTDQYRALFADNDIDGTILLGLTVDKLEKAMHPYARIVLP